MIVNLFIATTVLFNSGWEFSRDGGPKSMIDLPHDAAIAYDFDCEKHSTGCGALPYDGHAEYSKNLMVTPDEEKALAAGTSVWRLEFDGVMSCSKVWVNDKLVSERSNGYASFVVPLKDLHAGANLVKVTADPPKDSSRWYPGMGIYRDVRLVKVGADHVVPGSVAIVTKSIDKGTATVEASWVMSKGGAKKKTFAIEQVKLWSPETPQLYTVELGGETFRYGVRTLRYSPDEGFFLNGKHRQIRGVCLHHDLGVFGVAFVKEAARRQLTILKEMGCDAIRTSHNFPAPALLDLCDEMGLMVLDEAFDEWKAAKVANGMAKVWEKWHEKEIVDFVRRDRNHPCVVMWSAGNELVEDEPRRNLAQQGVDIAKELTALFHANDPEGRPVTAGHWQPCTMTNGIGAATDVFGANYLPSAYAGYRGRQGIIGTETCSAVSTRDTFFMPIDNAGKYAVTNRVSDYGLVPMHGNDYPPDVEFAAQDANPHVYGEFVWTGFDYIGEPDPWRKTSRSSYFGIFDLCGFPKSRYWQYKAQWRPDVPLVHIVPHWNWKPGEKVPMHVFTSGDEVELFLNGRSLGIRRKKPGEYRLVWDDVTWEKGELKAVARKGGKPWAEDVRVSSGPFARFTFSDEVYGDYIFRTAQAVDAKGLPVPDAFEPVSYEMPRDCSLVGTCNGDPAELKSLCSAQIRSFAGKALIVFRRNGRAAIDAMSLDRPGAVKPSGWLKDWAQAAARGYTGHMEDVDSEFVRAWTKDFTPRRAALNWWHKPQGAWSCEGGAYWFDGLVRLAFQLDDPELKEHARRRLEPVLENMTDYPVGFCWWLDRRDPVQVAEVRDADSWHVWVCGMFARPISAWYEATGDVRARKALVAALGEDYLFREFKEKCTVPGGMYEAFRITGDAGIASVLDAHAARMAAAPTFATYSSAPWEGLEETLNLRRLHHQKLGLPSRHGVMASESLLSVFAAYRRSGDSRLLDAVRKWYAFFDRHCRQPYGVTMFDEEYGHPGPDRATETCCVAAESWTRINLMAGLGEGIWGDDVERAFFNAGAASVSRDWHDHVYMQPPNRTRANPNEKYSCQAGGAAYGRKQYPLCCTAALNRILPNYIQSMWMKCADGGVAATLYGPSVFETILRGGCFAAEEVTDYPFSDRVTIKITAAPSVTIPLRLRMPGWCAKADVAINGKPLGEMGVSPVQKGFKTITRTWKAGDEISLRLPMTAHVGRMRDRNDFGKPYVWFSYGPLLFARGFAERDLNTPAEDAYIPAVDPETALDGAVIRRKALPQPWCWQLDAPIKLRIKDAEGHSLDLVPYGCTRLRASLFPER